MADLEKHNPEFEITVNLDGENKTIVVQPEETSDGVEYYICSLDGGEITQVRLDEEGAHQLWGDLNQTSVDEIAKAILEQQNA